MISVQFVHRTFAYLVVVVVGLLWMEARKFELSKWQSNSVNALIGMVLIQFALGVVTLLYLVPVSLGVAHQLGALVLLSVSIFLNYGLPLRMNKG